MTLLSYTVWSTDSFNSVHMLLKLLVNVALGKNDDFIEDCN